MSDCSDNEIKRDSELQEMYGEIYHLAQRYERFTIVIAILVAILATFFSINLLFSGANNNGDRVDKLEKDYSVMKDAVLRAERDAAFANGLAIRQRDYSDADIKRLEGMIEGDSNRIDNHDRILQQMVPEVRYYAPPNNDPHEKDYVQGNDLPDAYFTMKPSELGKKAPRMIVEGHKLEFKPSEDRYYYAGTDVPANLNTTTGLLPGGMHWTLFPSTKTYFKDGKSYDEVWDAKHRVWVKN